MRRYDAASISRRTSGWMATSTGPNREIGPSLVRLRDRHRDLSRNNPWARRAIQAITNNTIGDGIQAQWLDESSQTLWQRWFATQACDADGRSDGYGLQALAFQTLVVSGEVLIRRRPRRPEDKLPIPLQIQVLEPDYLDHSKNDTLPSGGWITQGVEFNPFGQRIAYWLYPDHPGDSLLRKTFIGESVRYPASEFLHIYRMDRPGQARGVPWGTGAMLRLRMLDDYSDAHLERQRLSACYMAFVRDTQPHPDENSPSLPLVDKLEPGAIEILPPGRDMVFASPPGVEGYREYLSTVLRAVAADYGVPYETLSGDLSEVNFSSARMGWNEFARNIDVWRWHLIIPQMLAPLTNWFRDAAQLAGYSLPDTLPQWTPPARVMVDMVHEVPAIKDAIRCGLITLPEAIRQQGYDPESLIQEQAAFLARLDALGIRLDCDPRYSAPPGTGLAPASTPKKVAGKSKKPAGKAKPPVGKAKPPIGTPS